MSTVPVTVPAIVPATVPAALAVTRIPAEELPGSAWGAAVDDLCADLGAPNNPSLLPPHFLKSAFRRVGGEIFSVARGTETVGAAFLLPRALSPAGRCVYTLRLHAAPQFGPLDGEEVAVLVTAHLGGEPVALFDTQIPHAFVPTHRLVDDLDIGRPDAAEAEQIRRLQQAVWAVTDEYLYPADIHTPDFGLGASLVARDGVDGPVAGSLFGFFKWDDSPLPELWAARFQHRLRLESQSLAVAPGFRGRHVAFNLKRRQAEEAVAAGVDLVEWTTDPLLFANAGLNFGKLRAVCTRFFPDLIPFRNVLNQLPASRLGMTLLPRTHRVRTALADPGAIQSVGRLEAGIPPVRVNDGWTNPLFNVDAPSIAVEVPADWAALQRTDLTTAARWRETTDRLLAHYIGIQPGRYILTTPAREGERCFLVGERVDDGVLARLAE